MYSEKEIIMNYSKKILVGGKALMVHGSSRLTDDTDYFVFDKKSYKMFIHDRENNIDYINANGCNFFAELWKKAIVLKSDIAAPEILLELKAYAYIEHMRNGAFMKANNDAFDVRFLSMKFKLNAPFIYKKYATEAEYAEIKRLIINKINF